MRSLLLASLALLGCSSSGDSGGGDNAASDHALERSPTQRGRGYAGEACCEGTVCSGDLVCRAGTCSGSGSSARTDAGSGSGSASSARPHGGEPAAEAGPGDDADDDASADDASVDAATPGCTPIPGTTIPVGAACIARSSFPTLVSPVDPVAYGADPTGAEDSSTAFQSAVTASDVYFGHPGTYLVNASVFAPSSRNIQCGPGVTLRTTNHDGSITAIITFYETTGGSVTGCDLRGSNTAVPAPLDDDEGNFLIAITDASGVLIEGNTFEQTWADAAVSLNTGTTGPGGSDSTVKFNTFTNNPLYGAVVTSGSNDVFSNNLLIDTSMGVEANAGEAMGPVTITHNQLTYVHGQCHRAGNDDCDFGIALSGGSTVDGFSGSTYSSYGGDVISDNYCSGTDGVESAVIDDQWNSYVSPHPTYTGDVLGPSCTCASGNSSC